MDTPQYKALENNYNIISTHKLRHQINLENFFCYSKNKKSKINN